MVAVWAIVLSRILVIVLFMYPFMRLDNSRRLRVMILGILILNLYGNVELVNSWGDYAGEMSRHGLGEFVSVRFASCHLTFLLYSGMLW